MVDSGFNCLFCLSLGVCCVSAAACHDRPLSGIYDSNDGARYAEAFEKLRLKVDAEEAAKLAFARNSSFHSGVPRQSQVVV